MEKYPSFNYLTTDMFPDLSRVDFGGWQFLP